MTVGVLSKEDSIKFLDLFFEWFLTAYDGSFPNDVEELTFQLKYDLLTEFEIVNLYRPLAEMAENLIGDSSSFYIDKLTLEEYDIQSIVSMKLL